MGLSQRQYNIYTYIYICKWYISGYKWYILPIGGLYATYHLLWEPENTVNYWEGNFSEAMLNFRGI